MKHSILVCAALGGALLGPDLASQDYMILCGFADSGGPSGPTGNSYPISRQRDLNGDGMLSEGTEETFAFLRTSYVTAGAVSYISDMKWVREGASYAFYIADSSEGHITRGVDTNNNGVLDPSEVTLFFDFQSGFSPDGITAWRNQSAANPQTIVYVAQDDSASPFGRGIHRLVDLNGDGDAMDAGEQTVFVGAGSNLSVPNRAGTGTTALVSHLWEQVHTLDNGTVIAYSRGSTTVTTANSPDQFAWYAFTDNNGVATASVFFNPSQINDVPTYPDFDVNGAFPQWDGVASSTAGTKPVGLVEFFAAAKPSGFGPREYFFGAGYNSGFIFTNPGGVAIHGLFYKWADADGDYRIDNGEISLFANFSGQPVAGVQPLSYTIGGSPVSDLNDRVFSMKAVDGGLHVCWGATAPANKHVFAMEDLNSNGVVETGEARETWTWARAGGHVWNTTFGPFIKDWTAFDDGFMPGPFPTGYVPYGQGCSHPITKLAPVCGAYGGRPVVGGSFALAVERVPPGSFSYAIFGVGQTSTPLPPTVAPAGCNLLIALPSVASSAIVAGANGVARLPLTLANDPQLVGVQVQLQWVTFVPPAPGSLATSNGMTITLQ
ncbi:MAG: hypothetical protein IPM29_17525 [Planctomycetes bacterium]|nr:hypothetical protein [Planctomycetota bacterium]